MPMKSCAWILETLKRINRTQLGLDFDVGGQKDRRDDAYIFSLSQFVPFC